MRFALFVLMLVMGTAFVAARLSDRLEYQSCAQRSFVQRAGVELTLCGQPLRFSGANMYWLGLDENVGGVQYPTRFRVDDALTTAAIMGQSVVRAHTLGISTGNPRSFEPALDIFNHSAPLEHIDYAVYRASELGIKLIVPLTDNYHYYHGGKHDFTDWFNISNEEEFYTNGRVIRAFERYIHELLTHTNRFTGRRYCDEPTVLAWETGNELTPPANWTAHISGFIKSIAPRQLVLSGTYGVAPAELGIETVDIYSDHFYPPDCAVLALEAALAASANKTFIAGEYGWSYPDVNLSEFLSNATVLRPAVSGMLFWSLFPHLDTHGFVQHGDGFTMHYPGDGAFMFSRREQIEAFSTAMGGASIIAQPPTVPPTAPADVSCREESLASSPSGAAARVWDVQWRGAAGACRYDIVAFNHSARGDSAVVVLSNVTDNDDPVRVEEPIGNAFDSVVLLTFACDGSPGAASSIQRCN